MTFHIFINLILLIVSSILGGLMIKKKEWTMFMVTLCSAFGAALALVHP